jgi:hypothetical protein
MHNYSITMAKRKRPLNEIPQPSIQSIFWGAPNQRPFLEEERKTSAHAEVSQFDPKAKCEQPLSCCRLHLLTHLANSELRRITQRQFLILPARIRGIENGYIRPYWQRICPPVKKAWFRSSSVADDHPKRNSPGVRRNAAHLKVCTSDNAVRIPASVRRALAGGDHHEGAWINYIPLKVVYIGLLATPEMTKMLCGHTHPP